MRLLIPMLLVWTAAAQSPIRVKWDELGMVVGHEVSTGEVRGKALSVEPDGIVVQVRNSTVKVPRAGLHVLQMNTKGKKYRIIGTTVGGVVGLAGGAIAAFAANGGIFGDHPARAGLAFFAVTGGVTA